MGASAVVLLIVVGLLAFGVQRLLVTLARRENDGTCRAPGCDHQNRGGANFCARCGAALKGGARNLRR